jgi:hypothetical protein
MHRRKRQQAAVTDATRSLLPGPPSLLSYGATLNLSVMREQPPPA